MVAESNYTQVHFERGDRDGARVELDQIGHDDAAKRRKSSPRCELRSNWRRQVGFCARSKGHSGAVNSVCLSADGKYALSGSSDKMLKLWDVASGRCLETLEGHSESVTAVCLSADGQYALSGSPGLDDEVVGCGQKREMPTYFRRS